MKLIIGSLFVLIIGIIILLFPRQVYEFTESWKHSFDSEPSKLFIFHIRFGGFVCVLVGLAGLIAAFIM